MTALDDLLARPCECEERIVGRDGLLSVYEGCSRAEVPDRRGRPAGAGRGAARSLGRTDLR